MSGQGKFRSQARDRELLCPSGILYSLAWEEPGALSK